MAKRRMFNKDVIETDWFTDMPATAQLLYVHLSMEADDDGFVTNVKMAMVNAHASADDLRILKAKNYLIEVEQGLYLFKHWKQNNYIKNDRYQRSPYIDRLEDYILRDDGSYTLKPIIEDNEEECLQNGYRMDTECLQSVSKVYPQVSIELGNSKSKSNSKSNITNMKRYETIMKQSALCQMLAEKGFINEDELQDNVWDGILDEMVQEYGYKETKIALAYILDHTKVKGSYTYLRSALINELNKKDPTEVMNERMEEI